eukprot:TRINITY_DN7226_c0_g1_i1.p2 TRINITY_DN7226_c0_g1~~TRINITY_DN7226_c0_g1_i1.p2  ORF type:complete len:129 (+),score=34.36 TRINITY_DN7226_c0_g1_i1:331-717(+)
MVQRVTYRRRHAYATRSNVFKVVKTPGGKLNIQYKAKPAAGPKCGDCGRKIQGVPALRPRQYTNVPKRVKNVSRAYGGCICNVCVRGRVVRAFLVEEQKIVKYVIKKQAKKAAEEASKVAKAQKTGKK